MQIVIISNDILRAEMMTVGIQAAADVAWLTEINDVMQHRQADVFIDLLFENKADRIAFLKSLFPKTIIINSVVATLTETDAGFVRINAWPTFLQGPLIEGSCSRESFKPVAEEVFKLFHKQIEWLPDEPGFITPRVISMIINEAYFALSERVSTKEEIDIAMQLGTNYPYGPFKWAEKIGLRGIVALLNTLSQRQQRYAPCKLLVKEAEGQ